MWKNANKKSRKVNTNINDVFVQCRQTLIKWLVLKLILKILQRNAKKVKKNSKNAQAWTSYNEQFMQTFQF